MIKGAKEKTRGVYVSLSQKLSFLMPDRAFNSYASVSSPIKQGHHTDLPLHTMLKSLMPTTGLRVSSERSYRWVKYTLLMFFHLKETEMRGKELAINSTIL